VGPGVGAGTRKVVGVGAGAGVKETGAEGIMASGW
jgi:hypothetical protein